MQGVIIFFYSGITNSFLILFFNFFKKEKHNLFLFIFFKLKYAIIYHDFYFLKWF
jgi:hypothetical protein